ncbi:M23 family metallopeptidase [bacterium]|nr:M23 family metallopeptidase [bacterium]HPF36629.1 M23 family metallopeptidase [Candidatus Krumholzibacteria bacterium]HRX52676.1 M23 family metallopeptidase [Candidatus Krumholzibacteria bacterium]
MLFRFPPHTRILLLPSDDGSTHEFGISRPLLITLTLAMVLLGVFFVLVLLSYASLSDQAREVPDLKRELVATKSQLVRVQDLNRELEGMRDLQERLLTMLGVAPADSAADGLSRRLGEVAGVIMTPPPEVWPLHGYVTKEFQEGDLPRGVEPHPGIDLAAPVDTPIGAAGRGIVQQAGWDDSLGNYVEIRHGFGYVTVYGHCNSLAVRVGDRVDVGQTIGTLGGTGQVTAPHLHFEVWKDGEAMDPRVALPGDPQIPEGADG